MMFRRWSAESSTLARRLLNRRATLTLSAVAFASIVVALSLATSAHAGYGVQPNGQVIDVQIDAFGYISAPESIGILVYLDGGDSNPTVWVSESPQWTSYGTPVGHIAGFCATFTPWSEPGKYTCAINTILMKPDTTYYWWLDFYRQDPGQLYATERQSGPFSFTLQKASVPPSASPPSSSPPSSGPPTATPPTSAPASNATATSAQYLPASERYDGTSVNDTRIATVIYKTMKLLTTPRTLAVACWDRVDFESVVEGEGETVVNGQTTIAGFWKPSQPHWIHLSSDSCARVQNLFDTRAASAMNGLGLMTALHEATHAYGVRSEAEANCFAVQLVPYAVMYAGLPWSRALYLEHLTLNITRRTSPPGYWDAARCRDGASWDLVRSRINLK